MGRKQKLRQASKKIESKQDEKRAKHVEILAEVDYPMKSPIFYGLIAKGQDTATPSPTRIQFGSMWKIAGASHGCVSSFCSAGFAYSRREKEIHLSTPWLLEGALRGSYQSMSWLNTFTYKKAKPKPDALIIYWNRLRKNGQGSGITHVQAKEAITKVTRRCIICLREDSKNFTLKQCDQCSLYCYCSSDCQRNHWLSGHKGECNQVRILNKYHKPYANEIRNAAIRGDIVIPALEKLRYKLGLTRPREEYAELELHAGSTRKNTGTVIIDPLKCIAARDDGTVWVGSFPHPTGMDPKSNEDSPSGYPFTSLSSSSDNGHYDEEAQRLGIDMDGKVGDCIKYIREHIEFDMLELT